MGKLKLSSAKIIIKNEKNENLVAFSLILIGWYDYVLQDRANVL